MTEPTVPSAVAAVADATEVTTGTTGTLATACATAGSAFPAPVTTVTTAEPGTVPAQHAGQPPDEGTGRCGPTTGSGTVPGGNPDTVGGFGEMGGCPPPAGFGALPPEGPEAFQTMLPARLGSTGGPVGTGCG